MLLPAWESGNAISLVGSKTPNNKTLMSSGTTAYAPRKKCEQSMSRNGNCWDHAVAESFFSVLKLKMIYEERFKKRQEARDRICDYIEVFYNRIRIHSAVGYMSPAEYEEKFKEAA
jgi:transposase InsO family protein